MRNTHPMQPVTIDVGDLVTIAQGPWPFLAPGTTVPDDTPLGLGADVHVDGCGPATDHAAMGTSMRWRCRSARWRAAVDQSPDAASERMCMTA